MNKEALKYGPGSPGETSYSILESFLQAKKTYPSLSRDALFKKVYLYRTLAELETNQLHGLYDGNYQCLQEDKLITLSNGCLAYFVFLLMCLDSKIFFKNVAVDSQIFKMVTDIIYDNAISKARTEVKNTHADFNKLCKEGYDFLKFGVKKSGNHLLNDEQKALEVTITEKLSQEKFTHDHIKTIVRKVHASMSKEEKWNVRLRHVIYSSERITFEYQFASRYAEYFSPIQWKKMVFIQVPKKGFLKQLFG